MDKHVVWRGELYHKTSETASAGSLRWAVLMRESVLGPKRLALYRTYADYTSSVPATFVLNLGDMLHVERNLDPGPPPALSTYSSHHHWVDKRHDLSSSPEPTAARHQFTITTEKGVYVFSTRSGDESSFWVGKLNELLHGPPEQGVEYEFPVQVVPTPLSRSLALHGSHVLKVSESDVRIYDAGGTTPTSFVCPFGSVEKVDHTASSSCGVNPGVISLHCSKVCGTAGGGTITVSTSSSADISRILNHRRMSAAPPSPLNTPSFPLRTPPPPATSPIATTTSYSSSITNHNSSTPLQPHSRTLLQYHHVASLDSKLHPYTSRTLSSPSPTNVPTCGWLQHSTQNQQVNVVKSLPPVSMILGLRKQKRVEEDSSSSASDSDSDEDGDEIVRVSPSELRRRIESDKRMSSSGGGDFETVSSWVRHKKGLQLPGLAGRVREMDGGGFGRINSFPNISNISGSQDLSLQKKSDRPPDDPSTSLMSSGVRRRSSKRKFAQCRHQLRRSSSLGSSLDLDEVHVKTIASGDKGKEEDAPGSHDLLVSNETYASAGSWQLRTPMANGNGDLDSERQTVDSSMPHYESIKEAGVTRQPASIDSNPDYDYVRDRILGVRGLPVHHHPAAASYSSDEEEHYYY